MTVFLGVLIRTFLHLKSMMPTNSTLMFTPNVFIIRVKRTMFKSLTRLQIKVIEGKMKTILAEGEQTKVTEKEKEIRETNWAKK